jgi:ABC-type multidrug transport system fused ATPase/permease subunit
MIYFLILRRLASHINIFSQQWNMLMKFPPNIRKILWVFDDSDKPFIKNGDIQFEALKNEIAFKDIRFSYIPGIPIIKGVSFSVKKGQILAIVGPTGAGKTTVVNFLPRFYEYDSGAIEIDGINLREFEEKSLRKKIGIVTQDAMLMNDTIKNNITYGLEKNDCNDISFEAAVHNAQLHDFIMSLPEKYDTIVGDRGIRLSGGEKQRVSIARAMLKNPDIISLDEATSSLDSHTEKLIQQAINNAVKGKTVFVIAHRLSTIKNADWIIVLEDGQIPEQGPLKELLEKKNRFYYYWELQKLFY